MALLRTDHKAPPPEKLAETEWVDPEYQPREHLSVSTLQTFDKCPRLYFYKKSGICSPNPAPALTYGVAMHKAFPVVLTEGLDAGFEAFKSVWDESLADKKRNLACAKRSLQHFDFTHKGGRSLYKLVDPPKGDIGMEDDTSPYEVPFAIDIGLPIPLVGRIDGLVQHRDTGELWGLEFKTTSRLTSNFGAAFEMNTQLLSYALVLSMLVDQPIVGMMVEGMLVSPTKVDGMTHLEYIQQHHLNDILKWLQITGQSLLACEESMTEDDPGAAFPKDFTGCTAYTNFYIPTFRCDYTNLCRAGKWEHAIRLYNISIKETESGFGKMTKGSKECPI